MTSENVGERFVACLSISIHQSEHLTAMGFWIAFTSGVVWAWLSPFISYYVLLKWSLGFWEIQKVAKVHIYNIVSSLGSLPGSGSFFEIIYWLSLLKYRIRDHVYADRVLRYCSSLLAFLSCAGDYCYSKQRFCSWYPASLNSMLTASTIGFPKPRKVVGQAHGFWELLWISLVDARSGSWFDCRFSRLVLSSWACQVICLANLMVGLNLAASSGQEYFQWIPGDSASDGNLLILVSSWSGRSSGSPNPTRALFLLCSAWSL